MERETRVIVLIDMDCFFCQVEEKLNPALQGKPIAVVQYNPWKGGGIIAVNYVARAMGVTRHMRGDEAKEKCPEINLPSVPCFRGKADTNRYREAGKEVARVLQKFTPLLERASVDEAYLDVTTAVQERMKSLEINSITIDMLPNTYALGYDKLEQFITDIHNYGNECIDYDLEHTRKLLIGAVIVGEIREAVYRDTGYRCSAGIAHNKILAKLVCGMNKPNKQTILPKHSVNILYRTLPIKKVKNLGGKFGDSVCNTLSITNMADLQKYTEKQLQTKFDDKNGTWLYNLARGIDTEPVQARFNPKSIGCCKQLRGKSALTDMNSLKQWLRDLGDEIEDRLEKDSLENNRIPKQMVVSFIAQLPGGKDVNTSRSYNFTCEDEICTEFFLTKSLELILDSTESVKPKDNESNRKLKTTIKFLAISVGKFEDKDDGKKTRKIIDFFLTGSTKPNINIKPTEKTDGNHVETIAQTDSENEKQGKQYLMKKFFQESHEINENKETQNTNEPETPSKYNISVAQSSLQTQELFFERFLNGNFNYDSHTNIHKSGNEDINLQNKIDVRPLTPNCTLIKDASDSNDSNYTGSTITKEINTSKTLFEDDPQETDRISNIRNLLGSSLHIQTNLDNDLSIVPIEAPNETFNTDIETFQCPDCKKMILITDVETHSDYHLALKLRDEDRKERRIENLAKIKSNMINKNQKSNSESISIANFFTKLDNRNLAKTKQINTMINKKNNSEIVSIAKFFPKLDNSVQLGTCSECGKRIPTERLPEHQDFHKAQKLSRALNKNSVSLPTASTDIGIKRKRTTLSPEQKHKLPCRTIDSFFR